jgi:calcineurin-like phosphoesterase family protein
MNVQELYSQYLNTPVDYGQGPRLPIRQNNLSSFLNYESWCKQQFLQAVPQDHLFFASDHHFGHKNIIKYADRPFNSVQEMNDVMIERHNEVVGPDDVCVFGGDIGFAPTAICNNHLARMNGYKIFIVGNHDFEKSRKVKAYDVDEGHLFWEVPGLNEEFGLVFTHYPLDNMPKDVIGLHGHIHEKMSPNPQHLNLCVEHIDYRPVPLREVIRLAKMRFIEMQG